MMTACERIVRRTWRRVIATTRNRPSSRVCSSTFIVSVLAMPNAATTRHHAKSTHRPPTMPAIMLSTIRRSVPSDCKSRP